MSKYPISNLTNYINNRPEFVLTNPSDLEQYGLSGLLGERLLLGVVAHYTRLRDFASIGRATRLDTYFREDEGYTFLKDWFLVEAGEL